MNEEIYAALGQSFVYDEYKGDFDRARQIAEQCLSKARQAGDSNALADVLIWRGIVHILQGEPRAAMTCTEEAERLTPNDADRSLHALVYRVMAVSEEFNAFPDGAGADPRASEIAARHDFQDQGLQQQWVHRWERASEQATGGASLIDC